MIMTFIFLDQRRVQANSAWVGAGRKDARKDKHVADEEGRLHVVVRLAATRAVRRKSVSMCSSIILNSRCRMYYRSNRIYHCNIIRNIQSRTIRRTRVGMSRHLGNRQSVRLRTDLRSRSMECSANSTRALTHHTQNATCRIREVERCT